ncbi:WXG100 family type VII secretion target [Embleya sp. NPDC059259]|uniref:WXG100 family type VII secretion target n=1 Tax=unclassified Embleya TaxID=2699296 RepID=UPI003690D920
MPDGHFGVDFGWLDRLAGDLRQGTNVLEQSLDALKETGPIRTGHKDLDHACGKFHDNWNHGLKFMREDLGHVADAIRIARANYTQTEGAVQSVFRLPGAPGASQVGPDGSSAGSVPQAATAAPAAPARSTIRSVLNPES